MLAAAAALAVVSPVAAQQAGDLTVGLGIANVNPTLAGGTVPVSIGDNTRPKITVESFIRDNIGVELLAALPFKHSSQVEIDPLVTGISYVMKF